METKRVPQQDVTPTPSSPRRQRLDRASAALREFGTRTAVQIAAAVFVLVVIPAVLVALTSRERAFSPFDEFAHVDYLRRVEQLHLPRQGDIRGRETLRDEACRGVPLLRRSPCPPTDTRLAELLSRPIAGRGFAYEAQQPPAYYIVTAVLRRATAPFTSDYVLSARLTGMFWLSGGVLLLYWAIRRLGVRHYPTLLGCAVLVCSPTVIWQSSTVNNDAAAVVTGASALLLLGWLRGVDGLGPWIVGAIVAAVCVWTKPMSGAAFLAVASVLAWWRYGKDGWQSLTPRLALLLGGLSLAYVSWSAIFSSRALVPDEEIAHALLTSAQLTDVLPWRDVLPSVPRFLGVYDVAPIAGYTVPIDSPAVSALAAAVGVLIIASGVSLLFNRRSPAPLGQLLGVATVGWLVLLGPAYVLLTFARYGQSGGAHQRYALVLLPLLAASLAMNAGRLGRAVTTVLVAGTLVAEIVALS